MVGHASGSSITIECITMTGFLQFGGQASSSGMLGKIDSNSSVELKDINAGLSSSYYEMQFNSSGSNVGVVG